MNQNLQLLQNKVCVIVGASSLRGIGYATAELFARHGAKIVALDIAMNDDVAKGMAQEIETNTGITADVLGVQVDIQSPESCNAAIKAAVDRFGTIDCLVNSAAIVNGKGMLSIPSDEFDQMIGVNLKGAFNICQSAIRIFVEKQSGTIVNLASSAAQRGGGLVGGPHYAASKGGVISLTRTIAREFGPQGIRANVICPAMIETSMLDVLDETRLAGIIDAIPLKKAGRPLDAANACLFLASDMSAFVTGATIDVNGGTHIH
ncbi:SDR family NAD(P)-dependent oxidoreductase [Phaeobacter inhibens]|jgi:NAD(P)-dependent dehydrogenase (short-subunit alcohol dehydrogenase family)|uniref:3-oxoacyl-[acyl-carrier-protein] reductase FabG n=1 Tax=Phaeobacter inhibens TaxID=221822 RepID=A0A2I7KG30_9RHOB|nr:SDR family oxidoreductase [Phaeobacter inhibens]AUR01558.1 3-oxoacyl-[acyl-carrier-protein] reductase FabG [Phaeobacter inhibens]